MCCDICYKGGVVDVAHLSQVCVVTYAARGGGGGDVAHLSQVCVVTYATRGGWLMLRTFHKYVL